MTRLIPSILLLAACSSPRCPAPCLYPPGEWVQAALPSGVLARADLNTRVVEWDRRLLELQPHMIAAVVLHEHCHLRGHVLEATADCCAAQVFRTVYGDEDLALVVDGWLDLGAPQRALVWMGCTQ